MKVRWKDYPTNGVELRKETEKKDPEYHLSVRNQFLVSGEKGTHREVISKEIMEKKVFLAGRSLLFSGLKSSGIQVELIMCLKKLDSIMTFPDEIPEF